ncbi:amino acid adenylation domain-containing protein [Xenorhabdus griffiniae]|uniref:Amino acid adenylation domain-containing protein n=1 Tax=Xenorhabdus griffiniae TaxID=351672 RepID=A0ABY9XMH3_9GAMM|nr:amino acid adenylation domain-containing protein [Xenorhabdus griffiniae]MBD1227082.1 amino acid adenylation domain-containing protein [Xenorhabdus griffiniae]MBE8586743.1 amino acid adenylation domain-containing protein [Xenorhabdus griffiniae]WMV74120.1 amino acid adenylation domain-containing protein [Xenorhabdus griffiniae]WNH03800.1 amino acid adenylation domain-containing protein [Xenorhabdus griffiniae]
MDKENFLNMSERHQQKVLSQLLGLSSSQNDSEDLDERLTQHDLDNISLISWFESIVEHHDEKTALVLNQERMSYGELNRRANQVAHYLIKKAPESKCIGIFLEPSFDMVISIIGILKAGYAYLPVDINNAGERIKSILNDAKPDIVITKCLYLKMLSGFSVETFCFDRDYPALLPSWAVNPKKEVKSTQWAYVIYTSGSTGEPKGVPIAHYNVIHLFRAAEERFDFSDKDVWSCFHSIAFDFSVWEIWGALLKGGTLVLVPYNISRNPPKFYELLVREKVTVLNQTPTAFRLLIQTDDYMSNRTEPLSLRYVIFGGEMLNVSSLRQWTDKYGYEQPALINMYGITETTVHVTFHQIKPDDLVSNISPIGLPLPGVIIHLLNEAGQPVQENQAGEMYIAGLGVANGYLNRPKLSRQRFIPNTFDKSSLNLYRTGDLARYKGNGELYYLGRIDNQIQIRGFRVELGEIESAMRKLSFVKDAIATTYRQDSNDLKIVVLYQSNTADNIQHKEIRQLLKKYLPDYMLPDFTANVVEFPMNKNGKLDLNQIGWGKDDINDNSVI